MSVRIKPEKVYWRKEVIMAVAAKKRISEASPAKERQKLYSRAGLAAYNRARRKGVSVCFAEGTAIYRLSPDGTKKKIGRVQPTVKLDKKVFVLG